jgi:hypothetical protein
MNRRRIDFYKNLLFVTLLLATLISAFGLDFSAPALYEIGGPSAFGVSSGYSARLPIPAAPTSMTPHPHP